MIYLYLTPFFPSPESWRGGFCYDAVQALRRNGRFDVRVMKAEPGEDYEIGGICVYRFQRREFCQSNYFPRLYRRINERIFFAKLQQMGVEPSEVAICHVHEVGEYAPFALALKKRNPKCVTLLHHHWACDCWTPFWGRFGYVPILSEMKYLWYKRLYDGVDIQVFVSKSQQADFGKWKIGDDKWHMVETRRLMPSWRLLPKLRYHRAVVSYNGVDTRLFYPNPIPHDGFVIGCVANFLPLKRQIDLIQAMPDVLKKIPNAKLRLVGTGACLEECKKWVRDNKLDGCVSFELEMQHCDLPRFYNSLDLFVLPSVSEGFNCTLCEAQACGLPIAFCKGISNEEVLTDYARREYLFDAYDIKDLAATIFKLKDMNPPELTEDLNIDRQIERFLNASCSCVAIKNI